MGLPPLRYNFEPQPKRKWYEKLLGLNKPKYTYIMYGPFTFTIYTD